MRFVYVIMLVAILAIGASGCSGNVKNDKVSSESSISSASNTASATPTESSTSEPSESETAASSSNVSTTQEVIIKASYEKPLSLEDKNTLQLDGLQEGKEYIEVIVVGEISDFELISLSWDDGKNELVEKDTVKSIKKIENQTLVIKTYQPEGIPAEKLKWKSKTGNTYEYIINDKSLGDADNGVTKFEMK